jgi:hypothetical protein
LTNFHIFGKTLAQLHIFGETYPTSIFLAKLIKLPYCRQKFGNTTYFWQNLTFFHIFGKTLAQLHMFGKTYQTSIFLANTWYHYILLSNLDIFSIFFTKLHKLPYFRPNFGTTTYF